MIEKYITWVYYLNQNKELISKLDNSSRKVSSLEENISVANQCVTEDNFPWLQKEAEIKVLTESLKKWRTL